VNSSNREIGRSGERMNAAGFKFEGLVGTGAESRRAKVICSRSPDLRITRLPDHPITRSPDQAGFTLFEVLISMTLTGSLMVALLIGLRVANRSWRAGEARLRLVHATAERGSFIVEQISSMVPYRITLTDPRLPGTFTVLQANPACLRFVSTYSSVYRNTTGLVLVEYGIVPLLRGSVGVALRETPVGDNLVLCRKLIRSVTTDQDTGIPVINYQPFTLEESDLLLMVGLRAARFDYLDMHPQRGPGPIWRESWRSSDEAPYPEAVRLSWVDATQTGQVIMPIRAKPIPPAQQTTQ